MFTFENKNQYIRDKPKCRRTVLSHFNHILCLLEIDSPDEHQVMTSKS